MLFEQINIFDPIYGVREKQFILTQHKQIIYIGKADPRNFVELAASLRENGEGLSEDKTLAPVLGAEEIVKIAEGEETYKGHNKLLIPAFVNDHCHVPMTLLRGYGEGLKLSDWLTTRIFPFEAHMTADDMYWGALLGIAELLQSGVASFTDMYMRLSGIYRAVFESGIKANMSNPASLSGCKSFIHSAAYRETEELLRLNKSEGRVIVESGVHAEYTSEEGLVREVIAYAKEKDMRLQVHISETLSEHEAAKKRHNGLTPTQYFARLGMFELPVTAAHGVYTEPQDLLIMQKAGATLCHCPSSNLKLGSGIARLDKWREKGVHITLGTDGASSNNNLNMLEEITIASLLQKGQSRDPQFLPPAELLQIASLNGYKSQRRRNGGRLLPGYAADVTVFDYRAPHMQPCYDLTAQIFAAAQASDICLTMVDGKVLYRDGELKTIDLEKVIYEVNRIKKEKLAILKK